MPSPFLLVPALSVAWLAWAESPLSTEASPETEAAVLVTLTYSDSGFDCDSRDSLTVLSDGTVRSHVTRSDYRCRRAPEPPVKRKLTPRELSELRAAFEGADLSAMRDAYEGGMDHDNVVSISYARASGTKTVRYHVGSLDPPPTALYELESRVHQILGTPSWIRKLRGYWTFRCPPGSSTVVLGPCPSP